MPTVYEELKSYPSSDKPVAPTQFNGEKKKLSGRIIECVTNLPTQICKTTDKAGKAVWDVTSVRGQLALYLSLFYLQEQTEWETHIIGWTGELVNKNTTVASSERIEDDPLYLNDADKSGLDTKIRQAVHSDNIHPVWLLRRDQSRWRRYAEDVLWPLFHYIQSEPSDGRAEARAWHDYVRYNEAYLQKVRALYRPGDIIWIHDYYLLLLPQLVRMEFPDAYIGLYVHAPFPSSEYFRCLAKRTQLLDGMLGADKIGFQSESILRHFLSCCARVLGHEVNTESVSAYGTTISVEALPIGIDTQRTEHDAFSKEVDEKVAALQELYSNKKIIVGRDRLDTVRGVAQKLQAFEMFLQMYPEWRNKVVLVQVSSPGFSHTAKTEKVVNELVSNINSRFGSLNHTPVHHYQIRIHKDEYLALLRVADLSLITSVRDGMNTTSLEFVICQKEKKSPLILSEFSGTAAVLKDAIMVNPWDPVGLAKTMNDCLRMTPQQREKYEDVLYRQGTANTVQRWTNVFLKHLVEHVSSTHQTHLTPTLNRPHLLNSYKKAQRRLFLFDYDGTLTPIVKDPAAAIPSSKLLKIVDALTEDPKNQMWIISGRDQEFLEKWWGSHKVGLSAEHGCFMKDLDCHEWYNLAATFDMGWQIKVDEVFRKYTERTPGTNIERKKVALTWHYRRADPDLGLFQAKKCLEELESTVATQFDVEVMSGKANIEVRPKFVNKGEIVRRLVLNPHGAKQSPGVQNPDELSTPHDRLPDFIFCLGDDLTDEDMFRSLRDIKQEWNKDEKPGTDIFPTLVGPAAKPTLATAHLNEPAQVVDTLGLLSGHVSLFESAGSVDLDDRGHVTNSELSERSKKRSAAA